MPRALNTPSLRSRAILLIVSAALLITQALGLLHRVVHAPQDGQAVHAVAVAASAAPSKVVGLGLDRLFAAHDTEACASYDQLAHADFLWAPPAELCSLALPGVAASHHPAWQLAAQAAGYLARGPPRLA